MNSLTNIGLRLVPCQFAEQTCIGPSGVYIAFLHWHVVLHRPSPALFLNCVNEIQQPYLVTIADVDDLVKDFDYKPDTTLEYGIGKFVEWYKNYYKV